MRCIHYQGHSSNANCQPFNFPHIQIYVIQNDCTEKSGGKIIRKMEINMRNVKEDDVCEETLEKYFDKIDDVEELHENLAETIENMLEDYMDQMGLSNDVSGRD